MPGGTDLATDGVVTRPHGSSAAVTGVSPILSLVSSSHACAKELRSGVDLPPVAGARAETRALAARHAGKRITTAEAVEPSTGCDLAVRLQSVRSMKWQPNRGKRDPKRLGILADRAMTRYLFGPIHLLRVLR